MAAKTKTLTLRGVPDPVVRELRARAKRNHRSMQKEVLAIIESAVVDRKSLFDQLAKFRARAGAQLTVDEIEEAINEGRP